MTNKEKFANIHNLSNFAKNNPRTSIILAIIFIPVFPILSILIQSYIAIKEANVIEYLLDDWILLIKTPKILFKYINIK